jgi:Leucine-rich repeat (LRR) protein
MVAFLVLELYLLITILSITDRDLFVPDSVLNLPFVSVDISLIGFFILAPMLLIAFHYNLLFNLLEHTRTLKEWLNHPKNNRTANFNLLHAFMLNTRAKYDAYEASGENKAQARSLNYRLLNIIIVGIMSVLPLYLLVLIMWKFANYQSYAITIWHSLLIVGCVLLHIVYWLRIQYPALLANEQDSFVNLYANLKNCRIENVYLKLAIALVFVRIVALTATQASGELRPLMANPIVNWLVPHLDVSGEEFPQLKKQAIRGSNLQDQVANKVTVAEPEQHGNTEMTTEEADEKLRASIAKSTAPKSWEKICQNNSDFKQTKLDGRALRLANLTDVVMCHVDMVNADLRGASLDNAIIDGTLGNARLNHTSMRDTKFQRGSKLTGANLEKADLNFAVFKGVDFTLATAHGATFFATQLTDAIMVQMDLSHSVFIRSDLFRANMRGATLKEVTFKSTNLNATDIRFVSGFTDSKKQLIESPIKNCRVDAKVVKPLIDKFVLANCKITHNIAIAVETYNVSKRIKGFAFNENDFNKIKPLAESTEDLVNNIIDITRLTKSIKIDLSGHNLPEIPSRLLNLSNLEELNFAENQLTKYQIRLLVEHLPTLKSLDLSGNQLTAVPESFGRLSQLTKLELSGNQLEALPESFGRLSQLTKLDLYGNKLEALPESFGQLSQLTELALYGNQLEALPESFGQLSQLTKLVLGGNKLEALPESFGQLSQLTKLHLSGNKLEALPESFGRLSQLTKLFLSDNKLEALPESFNQLSQLTELFLSRNKLEALPESFGQLSQLTKLALFNNELEALPESFGQLSQLTELDLSGNKLEALPESFGQLSQLTELVLSGNQLEALPESFGQLSQLTKLVLGGNKLEALPESFNQLSQLTELALGFNQLEALPESFGQLSQLTELDLSGNKLEALPESFGQLSQLTKLFLSRNKLEALPESFGQLSQLTKLFLSGNQLEGLPESLCELLMKNPTSMSVSLQGNKFSTLLIVKSGTEAENICR